MLTFLLDWIKSVYGWFFVAACLASMVSLIALVAKKYPNSTKPIVLTAFIGILFTIPLIGSINMIIETKTKALAVSEKKELKTQEYENNNSDFFH